MARVPYTGIPEESARVSLPDNYSNVQPRIGQGLQQFGEGLSEAGRFYNQAAADNAFNSYQDGVTKLLYGDPSKTTLGQDGQPVEDTGYMGMKGRQALDARPNVESQMQSMFTSIKSGLTDPQQQQQFDTYARRYRAEVMSRVGSHSDQQATAWYSDVNSASEKLALDSIARNANDPQQFAAAAADLVNSRVKQAQLAGAQPGDPLYQQAVASGKRDALKAQVMSISATDPSSALRILNKNKNIAGIDYEPLQRALQGRADQADGEAAANAAITNAHQSAVTAAQEPKPNAQTGQLFSSLEQKNNIPAGYLARTMQIESGGRNLGPNQAGAEGYFQFIPSTAARMNVDPRNLQSSADGAARLAAQNAQYLRTALGRDPTAAELYLAHQQGAAGAAKLLANPDQPAVSVIGTKPVIQNGGTQDMTAGQFANLWINKFNGTKGTTNAQPIANPAPDGTALPNLSLPTAPPEYQSLINNTPSGAIIPPDTPSAAPAHASDEPVQPMSLKANAYQSIMDDPNLNERAKAHALTYINQNLASQQMMFEAQQRQKKENNDATANQFMSRILKGDSANIIQEISANPDLSWQTKNSLAEAAMKYAKDTLGGNIAEYGPGFWNAYQSVTTPAGDPNHIADVNEILRRAGPGGDLTLPGAQKIIDVMKQSQKSVDQAGITTTQAAMLRYAKSKLSFQQDTGPIQIKDPEGEKIFNSRFIPKFESAYDKWVSDGKNPYDFLTQDNIDKLVSGLRSSKEMAMARLQAQEMGTDASQIQAPPAPQGVDEQGWKLVMNAPPKLQSGQAWPIQNWQAAISYLHQHPSDDVKKQFDAKFSPFGVNSADILDVLTPPKGEKN